MKKIEKLGVNWTGSMERDKINELVDAVNELRESWFNEKLCYEVEQTQDPESKPCHWCGAVGDEEHGCGVPEKEPECEHEWRYGRTKHNLSAKRCNKCGEYRPADFEKPAKKECRHCGFVHGILFPECDKSLKKDELAERLKKCQDGNLAYWDVNQMADEARKWAVEVVESYKKGMADSEVDLICGHIMARLKESN